MTTTPGRLIISPRSTLGSARGRTSWRHPFYDSSRGDLRIRVIDRAAIGCLFACGEWRAQGTDTHGRMAIADARTLLQACLYHLARERPGCAVWIIDDDMRLDPIVAEPAALRCRPLELGQALRRMRATGADICIGSYTGAPPLPAIATIRGQLVDLIWNLRRLSACDPGAPVPPASRHNATLRERRRDYYHDLSKIQTDRQETPLALEPSAPEERCGEALVRLVRMIPRILAGEAPLRPVVMDAYDIDAFRVGVLSWSQHRRSPHFTTESEGPPADAGGITWRNVIPGTA